MAYNEPRNMSTPLKITTKSTLPPPINKPWTQHLTLDTLLHVVHRTLLNPFLAWILVLCLRAQVTPTTSPAWIISVSYAIALSVLFVARIVNHRVAHGIPRTVDSAREVVLVTGGASGLGLLIAQIYGMKGASVAILDIKDLGEKEVTETFGEGAGYWKCDVGERRSLERIKKEIESELGTPTIIVNCAAARIHGGTLLELPVDAFEKTVRTNLLAAFHLYQVFMPGVVEAENGGTIVTVSSVLGQLSPAGLSDYSASKAGLSALHRTIEAEFRGNDQIKTLLVEVGQMATPLFDWVRTPSNFFAPVLEPVEVAREIVAAVDSGQGGVLRLPSFAKLVNFYAVLPGAVQRLARFVSGIDRAVSSGLLRRDATDSEIPDSNRRVLRSAKKRTD